MGGSTLRGHAIVPCAVEVASGTVPAHVIFLRHGRRLPVPRPGGGPLTLDAGDQVRVAGPGALTLRIDDSRYRVPHGIITLRCRRPRAGPGAPDELQPDLAQGVVEVTSGRRQPAAVITSEMLASAMKAGTRFAVSRDPQTDVTRAQAFDRPIDAVRFSDKREHITVQAGYTAISSPQGIRLDVWPFSLSRLQRQVRPSDHLPEYWDDGAPCATGCGGGYRPGWPLKPFHEQHAIRAGIDELRPANLHVGVDIQATTNEPVYAIQSGTASSEPTGSYGDYKVTVGRFTYWHIVPSVAQGQYVTAYETVIGHVENGQGHIDFEEGTDDDYFNPLRPGGPLQPYTDTIPPVIAQPEVSTDGDAVVRAFDPQSFVHRQSYETPVLALAALAWRLYDARGRPLTPLEWALRGSGYLSPSLRTVIFAAGATNPGFECLYTKVVCVPNWIYNLAGGLTGPIPLAGLRGRYRLTVYAWDFRGNESALDDWITLPLPVSGSDVPQP